MQQPQKRHHAVAKEEMSCSSYKETPATTETHQQLYTDVRSLQMMNNLRILRVMYYNKASDTMSSLLMTMMMIKMHDSILHDMALVLVLVLLG